MEQITTRFKPGLRDYWQILLRRKWVIIIPIITTVLISIPGSFLINPVYEASTTLISQEVQSGSILEGVANIPVPREEEINTIRNKIISRTYMKEVADIVGIGDYLESVNKPASIDDVVRYLRNSITLKPRGERIVEITARHKDPNMAKSIADTIADNYVKKTLNLRQEVTTASSSFINQELEVYRKELKDAEEALLSAQQKGVLSSLSNENNGLVSEVARLRTDLVEVEMDLQEARGELDNARKLISDNSSEDSSSVFYVDPEVTLIQAKLAGLKAQYAELTMKYSDLYPEVKRLKGDIIRIQEELNQAKAKSGTRQRDIEARLQYWSDKVRSLEIKKAALNDKLGKYNQKIQQLPQQELELARLRRDQAAAENTYSMLLQRMHESELLRSSELQKMGRVAEVLDYSILPDKPVTPNRKKITILALFAGIILGAGSAFILEYFDRSYHSVEEVKEDLGLPVLAVIPGLKTQKPEMDKYKIPKIIAIVIISLIILTIVTILLAQN